MGKGEASEMRNVGGRDWVTEIGAELAFPQPNPRSSREAIRPTGSQSS